MDDVKALAESLNGPLMNQYSALAKKFNVWLSIGGFHEIVKENDDVRHSIYYLIYIIKVLL